jgi:hypothetical protein
MTRNPLLSLLAALSLGAAVLAGCGGSGSSGSTAASGAGAAQSEAAAAATGDIPDNQVFLTYGDRAGGYAIRYPEGWTRQGSGATVAFTDKDNSIQVTIAHGAAPSAASARVALGSSRTAER